MTEKNKLFKLIYPFLLVLLFSSSAVAQKGTITGTINDELGPLIGASIFVIGTSKGTVTDIDGSYSLTIDPGTYTIEASYVGFAAQTTSVTVTDGGTATANFTLEEAVLIDEVVIVGSRASNRTNTDAPVAIDVIDVNKLRTAAGQTNLNQLMHNTAPSFSSNTQTISDGTDHIDPASLRGLGPDQVLVLIRFEHHGAPHQISIFSPHFDPASEG